MRFLCSSNGHPPDSWLTAGRSVRPQLSKPRRRRCGGRRALHSSTVVKPTAVLRHSSREVSAVARARAAGRQLRAGSVRDSDSRPAGRQRSVGAWFGAEWGPQRLPAGENGSSEAAATTNRSEAAARECYTPQKTLNP